MLFATIPLVMAVKLRWAGWIFGFQGFGSDTVFQDQDFNNLDFGSYKYLGWVRSFWRQYFKDSSVKVVSFQGLGSLLLRCFLTQRCTRNTPCSKHFSLEVAALTGKLIMR